MTEDRKSELLALAATLDAVGTEIHDATDEPDIWVAVGAVARGFDALADALRALAIQAGDNE